MCLLRRARKAKDIVFLSKRTTLNQLTNKCVCLYAALFYLFILFVRRLTDQLMTELVSGMSNEVDLIFEQLAEKVLDTI